MKILSVILMCCVGCCKCVPVKEWRPIVEAWNNYSFICASKENGGSQSTSINFNSNFCRSSKGILVGIGAKL